nr:DUF1491 family protein [uncultured Gellertiella sp.]
MRLTSDLVISALMRRIFADGGFAAIERKGAEGAGAIFLRQRHRTGLETLYGPAPQSVFDTEKPERAFEIRVKQGDAAEIDATLTRELKFDPDLWVVEIETEDAGRYVTVV